MVLLLNPVLGGVWLLAAYLSYRVWRNKEKRETAWEDQIRIVATVLVFQFVYAMAQPSYMPKGKIVRSDIPVFEQTDAVIEDRNKSPTTGDVYDAMLESKIAEGLPFDKK